MSRLARKLYNYFTGGGTKEFSTDSSGCSAPSKIFLEPSKKVTVGQEPAASSRDEKNCVTYTFWSEKLPHISKQHALFAFSKEHKQWMIMDLKVGIYSLRLTWNSVNELNVNTVHHTFSFVKKHALFQVVSSYRIIMSRPRLT